MLETIRGASVDEVVALAAALDGVTAAKPTAEPAEPAELAWADARERLVPVLRGATFGMHGATDALGDGNALVRISLAPFLDVLVVVDHGTKMRYVTAAQLARWGVDSETLVEEAVANFGQRWTCEIELVDEHNGPLYAVVADDDYVSSRLAIAGWLASFRGHVEGEPIAIVPRRDLLVVGGSARPEMVARLADMAERELTASARGVSCALYTVDVDDSVVTYVDDSFAATIAHEKLAIHEYSRQADLLSDDPAWEDVYVAAYGVCALPNGVVYSYAAWTKNVETLLPETEWISLVSDEHGVLEVPFEAIADRLVQVPGLRPVRHHTFGEFPSAEELAMFRATYGDPSES
jgi:hypothetical protein